jgi:queuine tRNA-ribosyltransferase
MPVGTAGAMKGMHWREVRDAGADIVLGNTYHLMLRPGAERIAALRRACRPSPAGMARC